MKKEAFAKSAERGFYPLQWVVLEKVIQNFEVFFFFFRTLFSFNCYYHMHLIVYDFKSSNVDFFSILGDVGSFFWVDYRI